MVAGVAILAILYAILPWESLLVALGIMTAIVYLAKWTITKLVNDIGDKDVKDAMSIAKTVSLLLLTLTASAAILMLVVSAVDFEDVLLATGILVAEVALSLWIIKSLSKKEVSESIGNAVSTIYAISVLLLAMSISMKILIGVVAEHELKDVIIGVLIVAAFIGLSMLIINNLSDKEKDTSSAILALLGMSAILLIVSLIISNVIIPIGEQAGAAALGALTVVLLMAAMVGIMWLVNQIEIEDVLVGLGILAGIALLLLITSAITKELLIPIGEKALDALAGAGAVTAIIVALGGIAIGIGALMEKFPALLEYIATGGLVMAGISGLLWVIGETIEPFAKTAMLVSENWKLISDGGLKILEIMGITAGIATALGAMLPVVALIGIGMVVMGSISVMLPAIGYAASLFVSLSKTLENYTVNQIDEIGTKYKHMFDSIYTIITAVVPNLKQTVMMSMALPAILSMLPIIISIR